MRVSTFEEAFCAIHAGDGGALLRDRQGSVLAYGEDLLFGVGTGQDGRDLLRGWLDATFDRSADHSDGCDFATAAGKHGKAGRRDHGTARACVDSGIDGCADTV